MSGQSDDEYFDCVPNVRYCAVASPQGAGPGKVFLDFKKAHDRMKQVKGARLRIFEDLSRAEQFASTPVRLATCPMNYPPSPKADVDSCPFSSVSQGMLGKFRSYIEKGDVTQMEKAVILNPLTLVTSSDTPTLLQIRLRYNPLHVAAASGQVNSMKFILDQLNSCDFWKRIYPNADADEVSKQRQLHVTDLYLNSPELGNLETPLHFASKFGHVYCVRLLCNHPLIEPSLSNRDGKIPQELAGLRWNNKGSTFAPNGLYTELYVSTLGVAQTIRQIFDENFVVLVDILRPNESEPHPVILPPFRSREMQRLLAHKFERSFLGLSQLFPFLPFLLEQSWDEMKETTGESETSSTSLDFRLLARLRAFSGPMTYDEANLFRSRWIKANSVTGSKLFASIRLSDPEKGYERQGRYFSRICGFHWFEYWSFFDDFVDLSTEYGLSLFEKFLHENAMSVEPSLLMKPDRELCGTPINRFGFNTVSKKGQNQVVSIRDAIDSCANDIGCNTPIKRITRDKIAQPESNIGHWTQYRSVTEVERLLNDTLDESFDSSDTSFCSDAESSPSEGCKTHQSPLTPLTPLLDLFRHLAVSTPMRWILNECPGTGEPLFGGYSSYKHGVAAPHNNRSSHRYSNTPKRKHSLCHEPNQPANKKPSPENVAEFTVEGSNTHCNRFSRQLLLNLCRALPNGDPELEVAVALFDTTNVDLFKPHNPTLSPAQRCVRTTSVTKFRNVARWKRKVELLLPRK